MAERVEKQRPQRKRSRGQLPSNVWDITDVVCHQEAFVDPDTMVVHHNLAGRIGTYHVIPGLGGAIVEDSGNPQDDDKTRRLLRRFARRHHVDENVDPNLWHEGNLDRALGPNETGWGKPE